jgi:hypothetical protein
VNELTSYCNQRDAAGGFFNDVDHRQARVLRSYLIAALLGGDTKDVRFFDESGLCFRHAMFS